MEKISTSETGEMKLISKQGESYDLDQAQAKGDIKVTGKSIVL